MEGMNAKALSKGEASMSVKVTKKDGTVEEFEGLEVEVGEDFYALVREYQDTVAKAMELEQKIANVIKGE